MSKDQKRILTLLLVIAAGITAGNAIGELVRHSFTWADWAAESLGGIIGVAIAGALLLIGSKVPKNKVSGGENQSDKAPEQKS